MIIRPRGFPLLRGALVGGTAYALGRRAAGAGQREAQQDAAIADLRSSQHQVPAQQPAQSQEDVAAKLSKLGEMVRQGLLTNEEFAAAKAKLLS